MEKLQLGRKRKTDAEKPRMDPLMRALKALHSAGSPEAMTPEELEHQRRNQEILGRLTAPMAGMEYEELSIGTMPAAWTRLKAPHGDRRVILYCHGGGYTSGNLGYSRVLSSKLAHVTGYDVLSFEYRLAPEHPYPAAVEDAPGPAADVPLDGYDHVRGILPGAGGERPHADAGVHRGRPEGIRRGQGSPGPGSVAPAGGSGELSTYPDPGGRP